MKFTKMHGIGNDYVYVNGFEEKIPDPAAAARFVSDRHFGIGSDGLIIIQPSDRADCMMEMYNADGSRGQMCGNGIRCVAKYVYDNGIVDRTGITVDTLAGVKKLDLNLKDGKVDTVRVDMGAPILTPEKIPVDPGDFQYLPMDEVKPYGRMIRNAFIKVTEDTGMYGTCVSMGNPHCVVPVENLENFNIRYYGPLFEYNSIFPERINTEFITVTVDRPQRDSPPARRKPGDRMG